MQQCIYLISLSPTYFNVFSPAIFSKIDIVGFADGGSLDSVGHSYAYRYKTIDGRASQWSLFTNPASVPVTPKSIGASFTKGGQIGTNSGKSIKLSISNLDIRYSRVQVIHVPYLDGAPKGPAELFADLQIPEVSNGDNTLTFSHTGTEAIDEEITIEELEAQGVVWTTCKAIDTKDNRLFCGNLSGEATSNVETDFTVKSYNSDNVAHTTEYNPHLYDDLLYSLGGVDYTDGPNNGVIKPLVGQVDDCPYNNEANAIYGAENSKYYRYIKKMDYSQSPPVSDTTALYHSNINYLNGHSGSIDTNFKTKRGIWGAESKYFNEQMPLNSDAPGEYEGVRITFRVLGSSEDDPAPPLEIDKTGKLNESGYKWKARPPYYNVTSSGDADNYYCKLCKPYIQF